MRKPLAIGLVAAILVVGFVIARGHELLRIAVEEGAGLASGYRVEIAQLEIGAAQTTLAGVHVERAAEPVLDAQKIVIEYSLRDLLPGSRHRLGLTGIELTGAKVTIARLAHGEYDLNLPGPPRWSPPAAARINPVPLRFWVRMHDAQLEFLEPGAYDVSAKHVVVHSLNADAVVDTSAVTQYRLTGAFKERRPEPFTVAGKIDVIRGYAMHHAWAVRFPLRALANYFADTPAVRILKGAAHNFDARLYSLDVKPDGSADYHVSLRLDVDGGRLAFQALAQPLDDVRGQVQVVDNAVFVRGLRASLVGMPLQVTGGAYDLTGTLTGQARLRLGIDGSGDFTQLRRAFSFTTGQPVSGKVRMGVLVEGPIDDPVIVARTEAPRAVYRTVPFDGLHAVVVYHTNVIALAPLRARYGGIDIGVRGAMDLGDHIGSHFAVHISGSASRLPYLDEMLGDEPLVIDAAVSGTDLLFRVNAAAASARGVDRVAALLEMNPNGTVAVDPFWFHTARGDFDGGYLLDRPHDTSSFWIQAANVRMRVPAVKPFPGIDLPQMPPVDARQIAMTIAGGGSGNHIVIGGLVNGEQTTISGVHFNDLNAAFAGTLREAAVNLLHATGPWGSFNGSGAFSTQRFVAYGAYHGTFEGLQPFLGSAITGHGHLGGTVGIAIEPQRIVVLGSNLSMPGATLRGIPMTRASVALAVAGNELRIYSAHARAADGDIVAAGKFWVGPTTGVIPGGDQLSLVANHLNASGLRGIGLPLDAGRLSATGNLAAGAPLPAFEGGVTIARGHMAQYAISGGGDVRLAGDSVSLQHVVGAIGRTYARVDGNIGALTSSTPAYGLDANVPAGDIASAMHTFGLPNYMTEGSFNARLRVDGSSRSPTVSGYVGVPAGNVNGLPFIDGSAKLAASANGASIHHGRVLIGTTYAHFTAVAQPQENAVHVSATRADLSDFNNFFDTGDTLDGNGSVRFAAALRRRSITSSGDIDVRGFRYRNLPIGDTRLVWSSAHNQIIGTVAVGGKEGMLHARGSIALTPQAQWQAALLRSQLDLTGDVSDLDLSLWMPALGLQSVPITGRASGEARVRGRFPAIDVAGQARVTDGSLGPLTLNSAQVALHSVGSRIAIENAELTTPELSASASGTLGLRVTDPLNVVVRASTGDLPQLVYELSRKRIPVSGSFESNLRIGGTYKTPTFIVGFSGSSVVAYGIPIKTLFGDVALHGNSLVLSDAGATFAHGQATIAGSVPLQLAPLRLAAPTSPVRFDLNVVDLDPSILDATLGNNTKLTGIINGHIGLSGTVNDPIVIGTASLANGSYVSDLERTPITHTVAQLSFNRTAASIDRLSANLGTGSISGSGRIAFPNGLGNGGASITFNAVARGAQLNLPAYGTGTLDARVALTKQAGSTALLSGNVTLSNAALPFATFVKAAQQSGTSGGLPIPLAFDLHATAAKNVRVRGNGYGAGLDLGARGSVHLGGTLAAPTLAGAVNSTGGTLTYFDRAFRVQEGSVTFNATDGVLPTIHAVAVTNVVNPDPDRARNPYGSADITIKVDGPVSGLKIGLTSNPSGYTRDQIIALIAPFGGFVNGVAFSTQSRLAVQSPGGITPLGAVSPIPNVYTQQNSTISVGQEAFNILNAQFTAGLLSPVETTIGQGLGLSSVNLTLGYYGNVGVSATRVLGKTVNAVYAVTFGLPQIQSFGLQVQATPTTAATLSFFYQSGPQRLLQLPGSPVGGYNVGYLAGQPLIGNSGFSLTVQHFFW